MTLDQIVARYFTVTRLIAEHREKVRNLSRERHDMIMRLHSSGLSYPTIASITGVSRSRVQQFIAKKKQYDANHE